jgi:hypothetical protein
VERLLPSAPPSRNCGSAEPGDAAQYSPTRRRRPPPAIHFFSESSTDIFFLFQFLIMLKNWLLIRKAKLEDDGFGWNQS